MEIEFPFKWYQLEVIFYVIFCEDKSSNIKNLKICDHR